MGGSILRTPRDRRLGSRLPAIVCALLLAACGESRPADAALRAVDDAGDTIVLARPARRVVSLVPAVTELLFAVDAGDAVVGRTRWCDHPAEALAVPDLGDGIAPNLEAVLARRPDLVVLYPSGGNAAAVRRLRELGIPVFQARTDRVADVPRLARALAHLTGHSAAADSLAARYGRELEAATVPAVADPPSVFLLVWDQPPMTVGRGSFLTDLIERAGGRNAFGDLAASAAPVSIEAVVARNPDLVLTTGDGAPAFAERPEWQGVGAVRDRRFVSIAGSLFEHPGPRTPEAVRLLAERLRKAVR